MKTKGTHFSTGPTTSSRHSKTPCSIFLRSSIPMHKGESFALCPGKPDQAMHHSDGGTDRVGEGRVGLHGWYPSHDWG